MFSKGSVRLEILILGDVWGVERKKFSRLAITRHDPLQHTLNFYPARGRNRSQNHCRRDVSKTLRRICIIPGNTHRHCVPTTRKQKDEAKQKAKVTGGRS